MSRNGTSLHATGLFVLLCLCGSFVFADTSTRYLSIKMNGNLIGYSKWKQEPSRLGDRESVKLVAETSMKIALLGKERKILRRSVTHFPKDSNQAIRFELRDTTNKKTTVTESVFSNQDVKTWSYAEGKPKGEAKASKLDGPVFILGSNNFAHWQRLLLESHSILKDDKSELTVFLPDVAQTQPFQLKRSKPKEVEFQGGMRSCVMWRLTGSDLKVLCDSKTNELLRMEIPSQKTVIEQSDAGVTKQLEKATAEEILARHFIRSNVRFDDMMKVTRLEAEFEVQLIGSGPSNPDSVLSTAMQTFTGERKDDLLTGKAVVKTTKFDAKSSPPFPTETTEESLKRWLDDGQFMEASDPDIVAKAKELTAEAKTRWDAVKSIGEWVHKEISYTIADTPSARLALETRQGDCGPHSTLMVAMLRAVKVPARLVGGLVYTPTFGGSFGQHAWVEVQMGDSGWLAIDPTSGEFVQVSATHIKLFEGLGGVIPKKFKVQSFEPKNRSAETVVFGKAKPLAWRFGKPYVFEYRQGTSKLGAETFTLTKAKFNDKEAIEVDSKVKLKQNFFTTISITTRLVTALNAKPFEFERDFSALLQTTHVFAHFDGDSVSAKVSGSKNLERQVDLPKNAFCSDNNLMAGFVIICSQLDLEVGKSIRIENYHASLLQSLPLVLTPESLEMLEFGGKKVECFKCDVSPIKNTFWISRDGRFLRAQQGTLDVRLRPDTE